MSQILPYSTTPIPWKSVDRLGDVADGQREHRGHHGEAFGDTAVEQRVQATVLHAARALVVADGQGGRGARRARPKMMVPVEDSAAKRRSGFMMYTTSTWSMVECAEGLLKERGAGARGAGASAGRELAEREKRGGPG